MKIKLFPLNFHFYLRMCHEEESLGELYAFISKQSDRITQLCHIVEELIGAVKEVGHLILESEYTEGENSSEEEDEGIPVTKLQRHS